MERVPVDDSTVPATPTRPVPPHLLAQLDRQGRRLGWASTRRNDLAAELVHLHPTDWAALDLLDAAGPVGIGELGRQLNLSPAAATGLVDRLAARDLVERLPDPEDRRRTLVHPTDHRPAGFQGLDREVSDAMAVHAARFSEHELETVLRFMEGAATVLEDAVHARRHHP